MIVMENVVVNYPKFKLDCSLTVEPGMITGIVGENGAGKTTAFKALLGLIKAESGTILINGKNVEELSVKEKSKFGTVLSDSFFNEIYTIDDVRRILKSFYKDYEDAYFVEKCQQFKLPMNQELKEFSTGMMAKLKTLTALSHRAEILILDEPTSGLDIHARYEILDLLQEYLDKHPEGCILISSHNSNDLEVLCDDIYYLKNGQVLLHEETDVLLDSYGIIRVAEEELEKLDRRYLLYRKKSYYGYDVLTNQFAYYKENYPETVVEKPTVDQILLVIMGGEKI